MLSSYREYFVLYDLVELLNFFYINFVLDIKVWTNLPSISRKSGRSSTFIEAISLIMISNLSFSPWFWNCFQAFLPILGVFFHVFLGGTSYLIWRPSWLIFTFIQYLSPSVEKVLVRWMVIEWWFLSTCVCCDKIKIWIVYDQ